MKILMINSVCGTGSTGRICTDLAGLLEAQGHTVKIAYGRGNAAEQYRKYAVRIGSELEVRMNGAVSRIFDNEGFTARRATKAFLRWVEEYDPDVVHLHNIHGYYLNAPLLFDYLKRANKKVIWTLHDCWPFTGHCAYFSSVGCDRWQTLCGRCPQKHTYPKSLLMSRAQNNFRKKQNLFTGAEDLTLVTPSQWLADLTRVSFLKEYPVAVLPNGIDLGIFQPTEGTLRQQYGLEGKKVILGVASVWDDRKGLSDFIELSHMLDESHQIVLIGLTQEQIRLLPANIIGISRTNNAQELAQWYTCADVFFNPTTEDNYPTVNMEALACGTPVITYRTGGAPEMLDKTCGIAIAQTPAAFVAVLETMDFNQKDCLQKAAEFDKGKRFEAYFSLYR